MFAHAPWQKGFFLLYQSHHYLRIFATN
jgi:hypothetical protein